jgi:hypothetical protein
MPNVRAIDAKSVNDQEKKVDSERDEVLKERKRR